ncbi:MAG: sigma-70 family RNA polymerase sigma factor [Thermoflavifilum sp.]|nr:sigma-70 family RNA polymerase sigma factor [Thermoflavifilum sp.]
MEEQSNNLVPITEEQLAFLLEGCRNGMSTSQQQLYEHFCRYAMAICLRYAHQEDEARQVMNDGFVKIFTHIHQFKPDEQQNLLIGFKSWLKKIMVFTAIDYYRANRKHQHQEIDYTVMHTASSQPSAVDKLSHAELIQMVQSLSPAYRIVFNMFVIDGYSHEEIARRLGISVGTSKSNLSKAREKLRKMLLSKYAEIYSRYER